MKFINELFLFVLSVDNNKIINELDFLDIDNRYLERSNLKGKNKEKNKNDKDLLILMMRYNFGKFWNLISQEDRYKFVDLFLNSTDINIFIGLEWNNISTLVYNTLDKIIKYSDNVNLIDHVMNFYDVDVINARSIIEDFEIIPSIDLNENVLKYSTKNELYNFRHNINMFWLGLNNQRKTKLINLAEIFLSKLNPIQLKIIFEKNIPYKNYTINHFDSCKKNVILIKNYQELSNMILYIEESNKKSTHVDTIIFKDIDLSQYDLTEIPTQIKKIKFMKNQIKSIDQIHDGIEVIDCDGNYITNIDNLPTSVKVLICSNNELSTINNLPNGLEYLDCHTNKINQLNNLPKSLKYLNCNYNKIELIDWLPSNLIEFDCSKNLLTKLPDLPDNLIKLNMKGNNFTNLGVLPFGLKELNISGNQIHKIYSFNAGLEKIITGDGIYSQTNIYDLPNMLISLANGKFNHKLQSVYEQLVNNNF